MKQKILKILEIICIPFVILSSFVFIKIRKHGINRLNRIKNIFFKMGVYPIIDHYYDPLFITSNLKKTLREDRDLPGIDWNVEEQLSILNKFSYNDELIKLESNKPDQFCFRFDNPSFRSGDAEFYYNIIRYYKPSKIIEIGSGYTTLLALAAIRENQAEGEKSSCEMICIEPYEAQWLEKINVKLIRKKVEEIDKELFLTLKKNDILFIDSSHIIRPQGDVLFEYLEILPILHQGVLVHIHDIFSPKDYLDEWILNNVCFWNEQYLLEAFLSFNSKFRIIGSLNFLKHNYWEELSNKCPILKKEKDREPGSFWIQKL